MIKFTIYRIFAAALAIIAAIVITFFVMHLIPGLPQPPSGDKTEELKKTWWQNNGYLYDMKTGTYTNAAQQFWWFITNLGSAKYPFGIYFGETTTINVLFDNSMLVTISYALPAFVISSIIGVWFGYYAAKYRGKLLDSFINIIAVTMSSIPVFVLGILLFQLAGVIGLPSQYVEFSAANSPLKTYESLILPTVVVTLMGLPSVVFMSRNEFIEIFKSEYIKTARGKGLSSFQIFRKHILRNAFMPIMYATSGNLLLIFGGSIVIQMIFDIKGNSIGGLGEVLADGVTSHQYYFECFSILFFGGVYFFYAILLDWMYVIVDPRVQLRNSSELLSIKVSISKYKIRNKNKISEKLSSEKNQTVNFNHLTRQDKKFNKLISNSNIKWNSLNYFKNQEYLNETNSNVSLSSVENKFHIKNLNVMTIDSDIGVDVNKTYSFNTLKLFKTVDSLKKGTDRIGDSNVPNWISALKTFSKNKIALFFALIMIFLVLFFAIYAYASPYSSSSAITQNPAVGSIIQFLPPRFPGMSADSITESHIFTTKIAYENAVKEGLVDVSKTTIATNGWYYTDIYPYKIAGLSNLYPILGTDKYGIDYLTELSYAFSRVVLFTVIVLVGSTIIGLIYGGIQGSFAGSNADIIMQWITQILLSVPTLIWVIVLGVSLTGGTLSLWDLSWILILITWPGVAAITRLYVIKYKDYEFVQAARIIGMPRFKIVMTHLLPNTFGKVTVYALNSFGGIMQWPSFLLFIGLSSTFGISLSTMMFDAYQDSSVHWNLMLSVMMVYVFPYLAFQVIANAVNDSLDSRN